MPHDDRCRLEAVTRTREPYFIVTTPYEGAAKVVCYKETWAVKLREAGRIEDDTRALVERTLSFPTVICPGTTNATYLAFVNLADVSPRSGSPFVVIVDPTANPPAVASVGFRRDFRNLTRHTVLWQASPISRTDPRK